MKKSTIKSKSSPAPATKTAAAPKPDKTAKPTAKKAAVVTSAQATAGLAALAAKVTVGTAAPATTTIVAQVDVGFGNTLYVRGEGPGLSWNKGVPMTCVSGDRWQMTLNSSDRPFVVKFLINDMTWSTGPDFTVSSGGSVTLSPAF